MANVKLGDNFTFYAQTFTPSTGAAVDADAVPGYRVYEDETGTPLLTGSMALLDDANTTGLYSEQIAVTTANGFEAGKCYCVRITGVVSSVTGAMLVPFQVTTNDVDDLATAAAITALQGVDGDTLETLSDQMDAQEPADVWAYATRTLTASAASTTATVSGSDITITRGDSLSAALTGLGSIAARTKLWFTVKNAYGDADSASVIQIEETDGLKYLNGAAGTAAAGDITVDDAAAGNITITLNAASTAALTATGGLRYDVQMLTASGVSTLTAGSCTVSADVTRAVA